MNSRYSGAAGRVAGEGARAAPTARCRAGGRRRTPRPRRTRRVGEPVSRTRSGPTSCVSVSAEKPPRRPSQHGIRPVQLAVAGLPAVPAVGSAWPSRPVQPRRQPQRDVVLVGSVAADVDAVHGVVAERLTRREVGQSGRSVVRRVAPPSPPSGPRRTSRSAGAHATSVGCRGRSERPSRARAVEREPEQHRRPERAEPDLTRSRSLTTDTICGAAAAASWTHWSVSRRSCSCRSCRSP